MRKLMTVAMIALFGLMLAGAEQAEAKRFGMGSSFGQQRMVQPKQSTFNQQQTARPAQPAATGQRGFARTGMMGMLGGLALGGLLGALFFGGAFEGINFFDIVVIGAVIALLVFFLRRRGSPPQTAYAGHQGGSAMQDYGHAYRAEPSFDADEQVAEQISEPAIDDTPREPVGTALRPEIDPAHFVGAAKEIYLRMQTAWDSGDIEDIRKFCTPEIAERIGRDMSPNATHSTEVATLHAEIADSWVESDLDWVAVSYTAMLRERTTDHTGATTEDQTAEVNEVWIFQHDPKSEDPTWFLAGIQQPH